jgi:hypothetical protein
VTKVDGSLTLFLLLLLSFPISLRHLPVLLLPSLFLILPTVILSNPQSLFAFVHLYSPTLVTLCSPLPKSTTTITMRFAAALVSAFVALAAAATTPDYNKAPQGNAVRSPSLNEQVPEGKAYTIKWDHDLGNTVSIVLLRGPSTNVVPIATLAESIPNSGEFVWTPSTDLTPDVTHYGLLIVVEDAGANHGAYQWSTQFGLSKAEGSTTTAAITTSQASQTTAAPSSSKVTIVTVINDVTTTYCPEDEASSSAAAASSTVISSWEVTTTICPETTVAPAPTASSSRVPVGPAASSTLKSTPYVYPTGTATGTSGVKPTSTPAFNAAGRNVISFGAVVAGVIAFMAL